MTTEDGHNYRFGAPKGGWPTFVNGKVVKPESPRKRCPDPRACRNCGGSGDVSIPVTHPTPPALDTWTSRPCGCRRGRRRRG